MVEKSQRFGTIARQFTVIVDRQCGRVVVDQMVVVVVAALATVSVIK